MIPSFPLNFCLLLVSFSFLFLFLIFFVSFLLHLFVSKTDSTSSAAANFRGLLCLEIDPVVLRETLNFPFEYPGWNFYIHIYVTLSAAEGFCSFHFPIQGFLQLFINKYECSVDIETKEKFIGSWRGKFYCNPNNKSNKYLFEYMS